MSMTIVQKVLARASGRRAVEVGDVLEPQVHLAMSHENAALVISSTRAAIEQWAARLT